MSRNVGPGGVLFHSMSRFEIGQRVVLMFRAVPAAEPCKVEGEVVRAFRDSDHMSSFPYLTAVRFDEPLARSLWAAASPA